MGTVSQLSPCAEDGGCVLVYVGTANTRVVWSVSLGVVSPLSLFTDASGVACAYFSPNETGGLRLLEAGGAVTPARPARRLLEGGAGFRLLESTSGAYTGEIVQVTVTEYA